MNETKFYQTVSVEKELPKDAHDRFLFINDIKIVGFYDKNNEEWYDNLSFSKRKITAYLKEISLPELMEEALLEYPKVCKMMSNAPTEKEFIKSFLTQKGII